MFEPKSSGLSCDHLGHGRSLGPLSLLFLISTTETPSATVAVKDDSSCRSFPLHFRNQIKNKFLFSLRSKLMEQVFLLCLGGKQLGGLIQCGDATLCTVLELCRLELLMECEVLLGQPPV